MYRIKIEKIHHENIEDAEKRLNGEIKNKIEPNQFGWIDGFDFSVFMQELLVSKDGYVIDTGNWENANYACAHSLLGRIKRHPWIWKWFFMVG
jgi:hypothetical protein